MTRGTTVSAGSRLRHRARDVLSGSPTCYLPLARRRYPGPSPQVVGPATELVIDGYTRCASTYVVYAFQLAQERPVRLAHHLHACAQLIDAVRRGLPTLAVIREPRGAVLSHVVREPDVDLRDALLSYAHFYERLMCWRDGMTVGDFPEVTNELGAVVGRLNAKSGTSFIEPWPDEAGQRECNELMVARASLSPVLLGFESGLVSKAQLRAARIERGTGVAYRGATPAAADDLWVPSAGRERAKAELAADWDETSPRLRARAGRAYEAFVAEADAAAAGTRRRPGRPAASGQ